MKDRRILVFGGRGAIGSAVRERFAGMGWRVVATSRQPVSADGVGNVRWITCDPEAQSVAPDQFDDGGGYNAVCWTQGANASDSVFDFSPERHMALYRANCLFVLQTLKLLLDRSLITRGARLVVLGSIWQNIARQDKLSYVMTKAAVGGLVRSASVDLAARGILINAVLPSAIDTPMTRSNLTSDQVARLAGATRFDRLVTHDDVVAAVEFLCSSPNTGITGQCLPVDLGFCHARLV